MKAKGVYSYLELTPPLSLSTDAAKALKAFSKERFTGDRTIFLKLFACVSNDLVYGAFTELPHFCGFLVYLISAKAFSQLSVDNCLALG